MWLYSPLSSLPKWYVLAYLQNVWLYSPLSRLPKWYFDNFEKRCMPFYFGGCEGKQVCVIKKKLRIKPDANAWAGSVLFNRIWPHYSRKQLALKIRRNTNMLFINCKVKSGLKMVRTHTSWIWIRMDHGAHCGSRIWVRILTDANSHHSIRGGDENI